ncbi:unnamed protein product [Paramecium primaurelia]|uniref:RING-type domain-containing protein n=2 Tax=Paramecium TaxID=5884 RepID=A0A8S1Y6L1_9CILI|nr:unnamed protein product [Paramecium primaurelia]CAD8208923.1 unnamed protein product [Paramecium pentaurelia]
MQQLFDCPICLQTLLQPITLTCGHTFCKPCVRNKYFYQNYNSCPVCRAPIQIYLNQFKVNILLETLIKQEFNSEQNYQLRVLNYQKRMDLRNRRKWYNTLILIIFEYSKQVWRIIQKMLPLYLIVLVILMYMSVKSNLRFEKLQKQFSKRVKLEKLSEEIAKMVSLLKADNQDAKDLDIQNLVFSKIVKYLFTNCVRF